MNPATVFINPETRLLRSGWRAFLFLMLARVPEVFIGLIVVLLSRGNVPAMESAFSGGPEMIAVYVILAAWLLVLSWACLKFLERMNLSSLGFGFYRGWGRDVLLGCAVAAAMMIVVVAIQWIGAGTRIIVNPMMWKSADAARVIDWMGLWIVSRRIFLALVLFIVAGAFEELLFRGYAFQTLLRGVTAIVPITLLSVFFGLAHLSNPNATMVSTANTILAGVWLAVAYLKTRNLWFPTALHFTWNWMMGAFFGLPVSGLKLISSPLLLSTSEGPLWLTGGSYGPEGGVSATIALLMAMIVIWRAGWLRQRAEESRTSENSDLSFGISDAPATDDNRAV
jgi:membrane protease YdiL (CAAX protease family)